MPLYEFACDEHRFTRFLPLARYAEEQICDCGKPATKLISAPMVIGDIPPYKSPVSGEIISSRSARREDLLRSGCVEWEPGISRGREADAAKADERLDRGVEETVEREISRMPARKRELLEQATQQLDVQIARKSA
jgi:hypothetical protein